ncbi:MAG: ABC transporter permease [Candidatus Ancillula sp.]|nr:ABC transporter permease [Candidatus Ancillula sp.]
MNNSEHFVSDVEFKGNVDTIDKSVKSLSTWQMAWRHLRRNPVFWISSVIILFVLVVVIDPGLFTSADPKYGVLANQFKGSEPGHPFGFDSQGYDILARLVYGAQPSVTIGICVTIISTLLGGIVGSIAGFFGGWLDTILSRITDIFYAIPLILGAVVILSVMKDVEGIWKVVFVLSLFSWVSTARMMRGKVLETKGQEFIESAHALGASRFQILFKHIIPNSLGPVIVVATVGLGSAIVAESTLTFLGLGLGGNIPSWGHDINAAQNYLATQPQLLLYPAITLAITVLAFILLGDAVNEALDPKARK